ncbi:MAG TPA: DUF11 domain-containing protein [Verrucomicrobiae bacterium]|nr:DUF11 domain-containing protein [Verrucomicrobiae bacterium]
MLPVLCPVIDNASDAPSVACASGRLCQAVYFLLGLSLATLAPAQPANDTFDNASTVTGPTGSATGSTLGATKEPGEPDHAGNFGGASIWFSWQAPTNGTATFSTIGSDFDTLLAVYRGTSVSGLSLVAGNDDSGFGLLQSTVQFAARAGTTYKLAVDGYDGEEGSVVLSWDLGPPNLEILCTGPLTNITVGPDGTFQVYHASFENGQLYPPLTAPADSGFFVRQSDGTVTGLNLSNRASAARATLSRGFHPISQSLSQDGLQATMVMDNRNDGTPSRFQVTQVTRYRPGDEYFVVENTVLNQGGSPFTADFFAAGDLYLADSDKGFGFQNPNSATVGGIDSNGVYHIFVQGKPGNPAPVLFQEDHYLTIWQVIGTPERHFANTIRTDYIDNAAGLEWPNVTLAPGGSVKIAYCWAFGALSDLAVSLTASPGSPDDITELTYQAAVTNIGASAVTSVALTDTLPSGVSFLSASSSGGSCANQSGTITCNLGTLAPGQFTLVTIRVQPTVAGMITNVVAVSGNQADIDLSNNTAATQVTALGDAAPVLSIRAAGPNVVLRWQAICASCVLEQIDHLNLPIIWMPVGAPVMTSNGTNQVTLPRGTNNRFFRLGPGL